MATVKNQEIAAILQQWLETEGISQAEAARELKITPPVLWRQLNAKESIPLSRIGEFIKRWSPSEEETLRLERLLNEIADGRNPPNQIDFKKCLVRLETISEMLHTFLSQNNTPEMQALLIAITGLIDTTIQDLAPKKCDFLNKNAITFTHRIEADRILSRFQNNFAYLSGRISGDIITYRNAHKIENQEKFAELMQDYNKKMSAISPDELKQCEWRVAEIEEYISQIKTSLQS